MKPAPFDFIACADGPDALAQVVARLAARDGDAKLASGTQSLGPMLNLRLAQPSQLLDISRFAALQSVGLIGAHTLRIGAAVTHARIEDGALPDVTRGLLPSVAAHIAYRAVRNRGTLGGSLAHADPAADWVTVMTLLDAAIVIAGPAGERRVAASAFYDGPFTPRLQPDELIAAVELPCGSADARWAYRKACRKPGEFSEATAALWVDAARGVHRAVLGALDGMPVVIEGVQALAALRTPAGVAAALDDAGVTDPHARALHTAMLRRAFVDLDAFDATHAARQAQAA
ncbi:MAG: xanthine dehydrogenase family protein subunit M [Leptothrix sp. (in: b-proteobacteria)]